MLWNNNDINDNNYNRCNHNRKREKPNWTKSFVVFYFLAFSKYSLCVCMCFVLFFFYEFNATVVVQCAHGRPRNEDEDWLSAAGLTLIRSACVWGPESIKWKLMKKLIFFSQFFFSFSLGFFFSLSLSLLHAFSVYVHLCVCFFSSGEEVILLDFFFLYSICRWKSLNWFDSFDWHICFVFVLYFIYVLNAIRLLAFSCVGIFVVVCLFYWFFATFSLKWLYMLFLFLFLFYLFFCWYTLHLFYFILFFF